MGIAAASAQDGDFGAALLKNRYGLQVEEGHLGGSGLSLLRDAIAQSQFVLIGEDHGTAEIPMFLGGVCELAVPQGFQTLGLEVGPLAGAQMDRWIATRSGPEAAIEFEKKYPETLPFLNFRDEYELWQRCAQMAPGGRMRVWGLDQEFSGAPRLILTRVLETNPGKDAKAIAESLLAANEEAMRKEVQSGNPEDLATRAATGQKLEELRSLLLKEGNARGAGLIDSLLESRRIYASWNGGAIYESNRRRSRLMKSLFMGNFEASTKENGKPPKVLVKFGAIHMGRGFNLLNNYDLGNFVAELAEGQGARSLHIMILPVKGTQRVFAGVGRPYEAQQIDNTNDTHWAYLKPMVDRLAGGGWTMFDLRGLREDFHSYGKRDARTQWLVFGYDFLVLIPEATPSTELR